MHIPEHFSLNGRVAVVTGACGKLGAVWIESLLSAGARVAALDLPGVAASAQIELLSAKYGPERLKLFAADVTDRTSLGDALTLVCEQLGQPDVLVNNAGIDQPPSTTVGRWRLDEIPAEVCRKILDVNVVGTFTTTQVFTRPMIERGRGSVINIGSLYASVSPDVHMYDHLPGDPPFIKPPMYGASKAGVVNLSRYLATHLAPSGVRVNTLSPGGVLGGQDEQFLKKFSSRVPLGRLATENDLAGPLLFLASDASSYVTGIELKVDGGFTAW